MKVAHPNIAPRATIAWLLCVAATALAQAPAPTTQPKVGQFTATFGERSPHSAVDVQIRRHYLGVKENEYELTGESFEVFVPESYDGERPFGLLVWVSPMPSGKLPPKWEPMIEKHNLVWVGANSSGNERPVAARFGLALDAVHNVSKQYKIDPARVYVAGFSGGGKVASMLGVLYPDVFDGAIAMGGTGFYRAIEIPDKKNMAWRPTFNKPPTRMFERARKESRLVLLIGTEDFNYQPVKATYETGFVVDEFEHVTLVEVPGLPHQLADEEWLEKSILALDDPLVALAKHRLNDAAELEKQGKFAEAYEMYLQISMHGGETLGERADARMADLFERARLELVKAKRAAEAEQFAEAADILLKIRQTYGPAAPPEADELMRELQTNPASAAQIKSAQDREAASRREAEAASLLDVARMHLERDPKRAYESLTKVATDYPNTEAAKAARAEADKLLADPKTRALMQTDPKEDEAEKALVLAENYRRNRLYAKARERLENIVKTYPNTKAAEKARKLLEQVITEERSAGSR